MAAESYYATLMVRTQITIGFTVKDGEDPDEVVQRIVGPMSEAMRDGTDGGIEVELVERCGC